jgi:hypothetical protein
MTTWLKNNWLIIVIITFFIPVGKREDGSKERLSGFIIRQVTAAISDTFSFGDGPKQQMAITPAAPASAAPVVAPQQTMPPAPNAPIVSSRENVTPRGDLSPVVQITIEGGEKVSGQWLLAGDGGIAHHGNPTVALNDLKTRIPGNWIPVEQPGGRFHFFKRQS